MVAPGSVSAISNGGFSVERRVRLLHPRGGVVEAAECLGRQGQETGVAHGPLRFGHAEISVLISIAGVRASRPTDKTSRLLVGEV